MDRKLIDDETYQAIGNRQAEKGEMLMKEELRNPAVWGVGTTVGCEATFGWASRSLRGDRDETYFHFQNDLPARFHFQLFTSCIGAFREVSTVNLRVLPCRLSLTISFFGDGKTSCIPGFRFHRQGEGADHRRNAGGS
jgi:hypothetical protein